MMNYNKPFKINLKKHNDKRGFLAELYNKNNVNLNFHHSILSVSKKNVIRGLHFSKKKEYKLLFVLNGKINDFCINLKTKKKYKFSLKKNEGIFIPPYHAHGYECLETNNILIYYLSWPYNKQLEAGIIWNDNTFNINWSIKKPIISSKDKKLKTYNQIIRNKYK